MNDCNIICAISTVAIVATLAIAWFFIPWPAIGALGLVAAIILACLHMAAKG